MKKKRVPIEMNRVITSFLVAFPIASFLTLTIGFSLLFIHFVLSDDVIGILASAFLGIFVSFAGYCYFFTDWGEE